MNDDDDDDDATPSLSGIKTKTILNNSIIMSTPHHGGSEVSSSNQSETRWSVIRKLQSSIKTPLIKGLNDRRWESSSPAETNRTNNSAIQQLSTSPSSIRKSNNNNNNNNNTSLNTSLNSPKTPGLNSPLKGKYSATPIDSDTSNNNNLIASSPSAGAGKKDSRKSNKEEEEEEEDDAIDNINTSSSNNMSNISINLNLSNIVDTSTDDNNNNDSSNVSSLMMTSIRNMNNSMNITASPFNFGTPLSHRIATGSQSSSRRNSSIIGNDISNNNQDQDNNNTSNNNDDSNLSSFNIDDYGNTSSIQSSPSPDLDIEAMALALEESIDDGTPAPDFDLSLFPSTFQTGKGAISITEVYSSFASISNQKKTTSTDRIAGAMSLEQILKHVPHLKRPMVELLLETLVQHRLLRPFQFRQKIYWQCRE